MDTSRLRSLIATKAAELSGLQQALELLENSSEETVAPKQKLLAAPPAKKQRAARGVRTPVDDTVDDAMPDRNSEFAVDVNGVVIDFTAREHEFFVHFMDSPTGLVTIEMLARIGDGRIHAFYTALAGINKKLEPAKAAIRNERGVGYRFVMVEE